jgi:hypothetical protein
MQSIFKVLEKYYGFSKKLWFLKATGCLDAINNLVVSKTMVLSKL